MRKQLSITPFFCIIGADIVSKSNLFDAMISKCSWVELARLAATIVRCSLQFYYNTYKEIS